MQQLKLNGSREGAAQVLASPGNKNTPRFQPSYATHQKEIPALSQQHFFYKRKKNEGRQAVLQKQTLQVLPCAALTSSSAQTKYLEEEPNAAAAARGSTAEGWRRGHAGSQERSKSGCRREGGRGAFTLRTSALALRQSP